jgi:2-dehydropantoate 2-reductase
MPHTSWCAPDGTRYWRPPLGKLPLSGPRARAIATALTRGGLPSRVQADVPRALAFGAAALDLHMVALECAGWKFAALGADRALLDDTRAAVGEALAAIGERLGGRAPFLLRRLRPWMIRLALRLAPRLVPFDVERYLRAHYTKVGDQTALQLDTYVALARASGGGAPALGRLQDRLRAARAVEERRSA